MVSIVYNSLLFDTWKGRLEIKDELYIIRFTSESTNLMIAN